MSEIFSFLLILLLSESFQNSAYKFHRLDEVCHDTGRKVRMALGDSVHVFTYNSSFSQQKSVKCHLELAVINSLWGFSVYIQQISLDSPGVGGECDNDNYLQFGRDVLFVTTHLSNKLCDNKTVIKDRQYTEIEDTEMDVWLVVTNKNIRMHQNVVIVVTPVYKTSQCKNKVGSVHMCGNGQYCINRQLRCDGRVNCIHRDGRNTDETGCVAAPVNASSQSSWSSEHSDSLIYLGLTVLIGTLVLVGYYKYKHRIKQQPGSRPDRQIPSTDCSLPPLIPLPPSCPPPPYTIDNCSDYTHPPLPPSQNFIKQNFDCP